MTCLQKFDDTQNHRQRETLCDKTFMTEDINFNRKYPATYLDTRQMSVVEPFSKKSSRVVPINYFPQNTTYVWQGSKYVSGVLDLTIRLVYP